MHNKVFELIMLVFLVATYGIPSTLGLYRRYNNSTGSITAAAWNVSLNQNNVNGTISVTKGGADGEYAINVESNSEVDTTYDITVSNIPSGVQVKLGPSGNYETPTNGSYTFTDVDTIYYSDLSHQKTHTLYFKASSGATSVNNQTVTIDVVFRQA